MTQIVFLKDVGAKYKKGDKADIPDDVLEMLDENSYSLYKGRKSDFKETHTGKGQSTDGEKDDKDKPENLLESKTVQMNEVHSKAGDYVILEPDKPVTITLISTEITENTYEDEDTKRQWTRYELPCLYSGKESKILLPVSVVDTMWKQIAANNARPIEEKHPIFSVSKTGEGKKTRYSVIYNGNGA